MFRLCVTIENKKLVMAIATIVLICVLLFTVTVYPVVTASAIGLVTIVGTVAIGVAALASILMITLGASGMDGAVRNQAAASGTEPLTYMGQLINRFAASGGGLLPQTFAAKVAAGLSYLGNGDLYLDADATAAIADFQRWAWSADGGNLEAFAPVVPGNDLSADGFVIDRPDFAIQQGTYFRTAKSLYTLGLMYYPGVDVSGVTLYLAAMQAASGTGVEFWYYAPSGVGVRDYAVLLMTGSGSYIGTAGTGTVVFDRWTLFNSISSNVTSDFLVNPYRSTIPDIGDFTSGGTVVGDPDTFVGPMLQGQGTMLPLSDQVQVSAEAAANLHLSNYLRVLASAYAGTGTADLPVTDVGTGEDEVLPLSVPLDTPIGVVGVSDASIDQTGSVAASDAVASDFAGTDDFTMDLTRFFPFCVPFDLYAILTKFETSAEAPVINWTFDFGGLGTYPLSLDFSPYDSLAALLRDLETVAFAVGLMLVTKRLIQGGD